MSTTPMELSTRKREQAFIHYFKYHNISRTARRYGCQTGAMHDFAKKMGWVDRRDKIIESAQRDQNDKLKATHAKLIRNTETLLDAAYDKLVGEDGLRDDLEINIADYERLTKLVLKLSGEADQKIEVKVSMAVTVLAKAFVIALNANVRNPGERQRVHETIVGQLGSLDLGDDPGRKIPGVVDIR